MRLLLVLALCAPLSVTAALADDASREDTARVTQHLRDLGYTAITDVDVSGDRFIVDARNPAGRDVDVVLDRRTLEVIRENHS